MGQVAGLSDNIELYFPTDGEAGSSFPVVLFETGWAGSLPAATSDLLCGRVASHGVVVVVSWRVDILDVRKKVSDVIDLIPLLLLIHCYLLPNNIVNGFLSVFHFWALIRAAKTPFLGTSLNFAAFFGQRKIMP